MLAPPLLLPLSEADKFPTFSVLADPSPTEPNRPTPAVDRAVENDVLPNVELPVANGDVPITFPVANAGAEGTPNPPNEGVEEVLVKFGATPKLLFPKPARGVPPNLVVPKLD